MEQNKEKFINCTVEGESIKDRAKKQAEEFFEKVRGYGEAGLQFAKDNPLVTVAGFSLLTTIIRQTGQNHRQHADQEFSKRTVRSGGMTYETKRKIKPAERAIIENRKRAGENMSTILRDLHLM